MTTQVEHPDEPYEEAAVEEEKVILEPVVEEEQFKAQEACPEKQGLAADEHQQEAGYETPPDETECAS